MVQVLERCITKISVVVLYHTPEKRGPGSIPCCLSRLWAKMIDEGGMISDLRFNTVLVPYCARRCPKSGDPIWYQGVLRRKTCFVGFLYMWEKSRARATCP